MLKFPLNNRRVRVPYVLRLTYVISSFLPVYMTMGQRVGIGVPNPGSTLSIWNHLSVGATYADSTAPPGGLLVEGHLGIGYYWPWFQVEVHPANGDSLAMKISSQDTTEVDVQTSQSFYAQIAFTENGSGRYTLTLADAGDRMDINVFGNSGFVYVGTALSLTLTDGHTGLWLFYPTYRLQLPNVNGPSGQAIANAWLIYSDARWKDSIQPITGVKSQFMALRPVWFQYQMRTQSFLADPPLPGLLAQDVSLLFPEAVMLSSSHVAGIDYAQLIAILVHMIQLQEIEIQRLEAELRHLEQQPPCFQTTPPAYENQQ